MNTIGNFSSLTLGQSALTTTKMTSEKGKFEAVLNELTQRQGLESSNGKIGSGEVGMNLSSSMVAKEGRLHGDYATGFAGAFSSEDDKHASPRGAAANGAHFGASQGKIDRTSKLYEKSLEMENYLVKMMVSQMRKTVMKADGQNDFARNMYEDMLFDEYTTALTKNGGFGLADQMYLQLSGQR